ncbi:MAG: hypothetical protein ACHQYQ_11480 [Bacteriovoracales bacterium]
MKIIPKLALLTFSLWLPSSFADCPQDWTVFYCRGGGGMSLDVTNVADDTSEIVGKFKKNPYAYSLVGSQGIPPGSCAWYDRAIADAEPSEFRLRVSLKFMSLQVQMNYLTQCLPNLNCLISMCVKNYGDGFLRIYGGSNMKTTFGP